MLPSELRAPGEPEARRLRGRRGVLLLGALLLGLRLLLVLLWHAPAGDGLQYRSLATELHAHHRFAFAESPAPLTANRLPGYPLFLAGLVVPLAAELRPYLLVATLWNVVLSLLTALAAAAILRARGMDREAPAAGLMVLTSSGLVVLSCYGLTESLTACLSTVEVWLVIRATAPDARRPILLAGLAGAAAGAVQLVRPDGLYLLPALLVWLLRRPPQPPARRLGPPLALLLVATLVFLPWPVRNLVRLGEPAPLGYFVRQDGSRLAAPGFVRWTFSWASGDSRDAYSWLVLVNDWRHAPERLMLPAMYSGDEEERLTREAFTAYRAAGLSPAVDARFAALAERRERDSPLRQRVWLPLRRCFWLWSPLSPADFPMRVPVLNTRWGWFGFMLIERAYLLLALLGARRLWRRDRPLLGLVLVAVVVRTLLTCAVHPMPSGRYMLPAHPLILVVAAAGLPDLARLVRRLVGGRRR